MSEYIPHAYISRKNLGGNFCGHSPDLPSLEFKKKPVVGKGGIPRILTLAIERVEKYYFLHRSLLPTLNAANGKPSQQRSERREAVTRLLKSMLFCTDLSSLRVGFFKGAEFNPTSMAKLAKLALLSPKRAERAFLDLKAAGIVTSKQKKEKSSLGKWKSYNSVKVFSKEFFGALGLTLALKFERKKASKRLKSHQVKPNERGSKSILTNRSNLALAYKSFKPSKNKSHIKTSQKRPNDDFSTLEQLAYNKLLLEMSEKAKNSNVRKDLAALRWEAAEAIKKRRQKVS